MYFKLTSHHCSDFPTSLHILAWSNVPVPHWQCQGIDKSQWAGLYGFLRCCSGRSWWTQTAFYLPGVRHQWVWMGWRRHMGIDSQNDLGSGRAPDQPNWSLRTNCLCWVWRKNEGGSLHEWCTYTVSTESAGTRCTLWRPLLGTSRTDEETLGLVGEDMDWLGQFKVFLLVSYLSIDYFTGFVMFVCLGFRKNLVQQPSFWSTLPWSLDQGPMPM
jgi:hypothetical protein